MKKWLTIMAIVWTAIIACAVGQEESAPLRYGGHTAFLCSATDGTEQAQTPLLGINTAAVPQFCTPGQDSGKQNKSALASTASATRTGSFGRIVRSIGSATDGQGICPPNMRAVGRYIYFLRRTVI